MKLDLKLDKNIYLTNEKVTGKIEFSQPLIGEVKGLKLVAKGEERTEINESQQVTVDSPAPAGVDKNRDGFIDSPAPAGVDKNRDGFIDSPAPAPAPAPATTTTNITLQESDIFFRKEIELQSLNSPVSFEFTLPSDARNSYQGKHAWVNYDLQAIADTFGPFDKADRLNFNVIKSNQPHSIGTKITLSGEKGGIVATVELENNAYSPGDIIKGELSVENIHDRKQIKTVEIIIRGIEVATAQNVSRTTTIEEYKKNINWKEGGIEPFDIQIPREVKKSYNGKYSRYYWEFETHVDLQFPATGIRTSKIIEVS